MVAAPTGRRRQGRLPGERGRRELAAAGAGAGAHEGFVRGFPSKEPLEGR